MRLLPCESCGLERPTPGPALNELLAPTFLLKLSSGSDDCELVVKNMSVSVSEAIESILSYSRAVEIHDELACLISIVCRRLMLRI